MSELIESILLIEDDLFISSLIKKFFEKKGFVVHSSYDISMAYRNSVAYKPSCIVLDINLPTSNGLVEFIKLKSINHCPIIFHTSEDRPEVEVKAFQLGASDFVTKSRGIDVLFHRVKREIAAYNKKRPGGNIKARCRALTLGSLFINPDKYECLYKGNALLLTPSELSALYYLLSNLNDVVSRDEISFVSNGYSYDGSSRSVDIIISKIRGKLAKLKVEECKIKSVRGRGYIAQIQNYLVQ